MDDRQLHLRDDGQLVREEQVVVAMDAAANRVFDRQDAVGRRAAVDGREDLVEAAARHELRIGIDLVAPRLR